MKKRLSILFLVSILFACKTDKEKEMEQFIGMFGKSTWNITKIIYYEEEDFLKVDSSIIIQNASIYFSGNCIQDGRPCEGTQTIYGETAKLQYDPKSNSYDKKIIFSTNDLIIKPIFTLQGAYLVEELDASKRIFSGIVKTYKKNKWAKIYLEK